MGDEPVAAAEAEGARCARTRIYSQRLGLLHARSSLELPRLTAFRRFHCVCFDFGTTSSAAGG